MESRYREKGVKTEYLVTFHQQGVVKLDGEPVPSVNSYYKYIGSVIDRSGCVERMSMNE